jgi:hypothetical protein
VEPVLSPILRCFSFERRMGVSSRYFWRVVMPMYISRPHLILNYSQRCSEPIEIANFASADEAAAELLALILAEKFVDDLQAISTYENFLNHAMAKYGPIEQVRWNFGITIDYALTYYLLGEVDVCLRELAGVLQNPRLPGPFRSEIEPAYTDAMQDPSRLRGHIAAWERRNRMAILGLETPDGGRVSSPG